MPTVNTVGIVGHDAFRARGSPDGIVTRLRVSQARMSTPARGSTALPYSFRNGSGVQPASYPMGNVGEG